MASCASFATRRDFDPYMRSLLLENSDKVNTALLERCRPEICIALWGSGNPDISGIGMIVGYIFEHSLGLLFLIYFLSTNNHSYFEKLIGVFHDSAAFLCFSIQVAAMVVLIKESAGISTSGMGDGSVRVTEAVSTLALLPLVYGVMLPTTTTKHSQRNFGLLVICWLLAFYPFYCKMNNAFGPSAISNEPGSAITNDQSGVVRNICFEGVAPISSAEDDLMSALAILSYVPLSVFVLGKMIFLGLRKHHDDSKIYRSLALWLDSRDRNALWVMSIGYLATIPILGAGLLWIVYRVVQFQNALSHGVGSNDLDEQWTFGQVVAVTAFAPVLVECWALTSQRIEKRAMSVSDSHNDSADLHRDNMPENSVKHSSSTV